MKICSIRQETIGGSFKTNSCAIYDSNEFHDWKKNRFLYKGVHISTSPYGPGKFNKDIFLKDYLIKLLTWEISFIIFPSVWDYNEQKYSYCDDVIVVIESSRAGNNSPYRGWEHWNGYDYRSYSHFTFQEKLSTINKFLTF